MQTYFDLQKREKKEDNLKNKWKWKTTSKKNGRRPTKIKWKTNQSTKINLIGYDIILNSPSFNYYYTTKVNHIKYDELITQNYLAGPRFSNEETKLVCAFLF